MKKLFALCTLPLILISCEKAIDFEGDLAEPLLVMSPGKPYGIYPTDNAFSVRVSHSINILDAGSPEYLDNAKVEVRKNGGSWTDVPLSTGADYEQGKYMTATVQPEVKANYEVRVSHPDYNSIRASCSIPDSVDIQRFEFSRLLDGDTADGSYYAYREYELTFTDPGDDQYYVVSVVAEDPDNPNNRQMVYITSKSPYTESLNDGDYYYTTDRLYLRNSLFKGRKVTIPIEMETYESQGYEYRVFLSSIDEHAYKYGSSQQRYDYFGGGDLFTQPVQIYSNVNGGLGYLGGISTSSRIED